MGQPEVEVHRRVKDEFLRTNPRSPLDRADRESFNTLEYFSYAAQFVVTGRLDRHPAPTPVALPTTTGSEREMAEFGRVFFELGGQPCALTVFTQPDEDDPRAVFIPFRDATTGRECYPGGRYLDAPLTGASIALNFNLAYNPYCAYSRQWVCLIPPPENTLNVSVTAGERGFRKPGKPRDP